MKFWVPLKLRSPCHLQNFQDTEAANCVYWTKYLSVRHDKRWFLAVILIFKGDKSLGHRFVIIVIMTVATPLTGQTKTKMISVNVFYIWTFSLFPRINKKLCLLSFKLKWWSIVKTVVYGLGSQDSDRVDQELIIFNWFQTGLLIFFWTWQYDSEMLESAIYVRDFGTRLEEIKLENSGSLIKKEKRSGFLIWRGENETI